MKQAIVIRNDLNMGRGKIASQAAHASVSAFLKSRRSQRDAWLGQGMKKIVLKVPGEKELKLIFKKAKTSNLPCALITDMGLTQLKGPTKTAVGIGPAPDAKVDKLVGNLKLL